MKYSLSEKQLTEIHDIPASHLEVGETIPSYRFKIPLKEKIIQFTKNE